MLNYKKQLDSFERPPLVSNNRGDKICLDKNEAPFSLIDFCNDQVGEQANNDLRTYPNPYPLYLKLARYLNIEIQQLLLTMGSEQAIKFAFEVMVNSGDEVVYFDPTFAMIDVFASQFGAKKCKIKFDENMSFSPSDILNAINPATKLVVLANANNPTGTVIEHEDLEKIAKKCQETSCLLLLDEAYYPYSKADGLKLVNRYENTIVTRTFSKAWGLAGIRVGYLIAQPKIIDIFRKIKPIDELPTQSIQMALSAIDHPQLIEKNFLQVSKWKKEFSVFKNGHIENIPNGGNFIMLKISNPLHNKLVEELYHKKILVKHSQPYPCMKNIIRFSVATDEVMHEIIHTVQAYDEKH